MFQMPFSSRPGVADVGQVGPHGAAITMNAMTADAAELIVERVPPGESRPHKFTVHRVLLG